MQITQDGNSDRHVVMDMLIMKYNMASHTSWHCLNKVIHEFMIYRVLLLTAWMARDDLFVG